MRVMVPMACCWLASWSLLAVAAESIPISSPGFPESRLDGEERLLEDWGAVQVKLSGQDVVDGAVRLESTRLDDVIPAAQSVSDRGPVRLTCTVYRAPAFPAGVDVLQVRVDEIQGQTCSVTLSLDLPPATSAGGRSVALGGRTVLVLPSEIVNDQPLREWGYDDQATNLPGWARPAVPCDPAFRNIRAGMGGVPIIYRFAVPPGGQADVVLGFCESHWTAPGQRPLTCRVEGAPAQTVDPIAQWGQHRPGALLFAARDDNGDGRLDVVVRSSPRAQDANPILNAIWLFPPGKAPPLEPIVAGQADSSADRYVDVGGDRDQSILPPAKLRYPVNLPAGGSAQFTFLVASPGASAPLPQQTAWDLDSLRRAAREVWRDWPPESAE